jgi:hypothetical protein
MSEHVSTKCGNVVPRIPMPAEITLEIEALADASWKVILRATTLDVYDHKPWLFGCSQIYDHNPTPEDFKALTVAWLEHEVAEQLGLQPHAVRLGA